MQSRKTILEIPPFRHSFSKSSKLAKENLSFFKLTHKSTKDGSKVIPLASKISSPCKLEPILVIFPSLTSISCKESA